jgi:hypothetical protein
MQTGQAGVAGKRIRDFTISETFMKFFSVMAIPMKSLQLLDVYCY